jgi:hypothetical protein
MTLYLLIQKIKDKSKKIKGNKIKKYHNSKFICSLFNCSKNCTYLPELLKKRDERTNPDFRRLPYYLCSRIK